MKIKELVEFMKRNCNDEMDIVVCSPELEITFQVESLDALNSIEGPIIVINIVE